MEKSPDLTAADTPANTPSQQQISAAEQKSRMDLQMSTALHGTTATTQLIIVVVIPILNSAAVYKLHIKDGPGHCRLLVGINILKFLFVLWVVLS